MSTTNRNQWFRYAASGRRLLYNGNPFTVRLYYESLFLCSMQASDFEVVIGLEVHAQLRTATKLFCGDTIAYGAEPNTQVSPITLAHPGTLPYLNEAAVALALQLCLATHCQIERYNYFARKNYMYPDLPKGYQVSQHTTPIGVGGYVTLTVNGTLKRIPLNRIHIEEDAGKSIHDKYDDASCIDYNRAGTPLVEIVTEPAITSADDAFAFLTELRRLVRWLNVCDGNMEEGSLRCDANISVRPKSTTTLGTKVEVKNLNSIRNVKKAIEYETERMISLRLKGETIVQQTRSFDAATDTTFAVRDKEEANDYRYFPDPDVAPFILSEATIEAAKANLPELPETLYQRYLALGLSDYDAQQLIADKPTADYFETLLQHTSHVKAAANWLNGPVKQYLNEHAIAIDAIAVTPARLADIIAIVANDTVSFSTAATKLFPYLCTHITLSAVDAVTQLQLVQEKNTDVLAQWVNDVLAAMPDKVAEYKKGKKGLIGLFVGEVKKRSKGQADPKLVTALLEEKLK